MARRAPHCAYCGESLRDGDSFRWMGPDLPGKPEVGWHWGGDRDCNATDPLRTGFPAGNRRLIIQQLREIEARGPGRLVANKGWLTVVADD